MSVVHFENTELERLWGVLDPRDIEIGKSLYVIGCANRAAYMTSYQESVEAPSIQGSSDAGLPAWAKTAESWVKNLLYNCVTNGGTDFAPDAHAQRLLAAARAADEKRKAQS
jgi:hypothetical protein